MKIETWTKGKTAKFGYDFWYQPYWDVLVSSEWGTPKDFKTGFHAEHVYDIGICYLFCYHVFKILNKINMFL